MYLGDASAGNYRAVTACHEKFIDKVMSRFVYVGVTR
ncbi:hypothetical protein EZJ58_1958 [Sodalis ligni]|uniref:Uncharacterized protein n=1 Tax=Sodalis ligni TaxID=2697027 RepID=A0A4V2Q2R2_9GAMM|nr:hypothetical protein EZJ58_1958 [Sodalis ligni]